MIKQSIQIHSRLSNHDDGDDDDAVVKVQEEHGRKHSYHHQASSSSSSSQWWLGLCVITVLAMMTILGLTHHFVGRSTIFDRFNDYTIVVYSKQRHQQNNDVANNNQNLTTIIDELPFDMIIVPIVSMQRSSSTFLSRRILTKNQFSNDEPILEDHHHANATLGLDQNNNNNNITTTHHSSHSPSSSSSSLFYTCPLHHFITLNEIFYPDKYKQSGDAWRMEGKDLLFGDNPAATAAVPSVDDDDDDDNNPSNSNFTHGMKMEIVKSLSVDDLSQFLIRVSQRRCQNQIDRDMKDFELRRTNNTRNDSSSDDGTLMDDNVIDSSCPSATTNSRRHVCVVNFKQFYFHLTLEQHIGLWKTLHDHQRIPQPQQQHSKQTQPLPKTQQQKQQPPPPSQPPYFGLRFVILERNLQDRWKSFWFAQTTGDWTTNGSVDHKQKIQDLVASNQIPPIDPKFEKIHRRYYKTLRTMLSSSSSKKNTNENKKKKETTSSVHKGLLDGTPSIDVSFSDVVGDQPITLRNQILDTIFSSGGE